MTLLVGAQFGCYVRAWSSNLSTMGSRQFGLHPRDGVQYGGKSSDRVPLCDAGQGTRRDVDSCRPALHADLGAVRYLCAGTRRLRHRLSRRHHQLHPRTRSVVQGIRARLYQPADNHRRAVPGHRANSTGYSRVSNEESRSYKYDSWQYQGEFIPSTLAEHYVNTTESFAEKTKRMDERPAAERSHAAAPELRLSDPEAPLCAYTPEMVERTTGCPRDVFMKVSRGAGAQFRARAHRRDLLRGRLDASHDRRADDPRRRDHPGLLGNVGRPGGGILALRGHCSIQGSTDIPTLYNMLPTYLPQPHAFKPHHRPEGYLEERNHRRPAGGTISRNTRSAC